MSPEPRLGTDLLTAVGGPGDTEAEYNRQLGEEYLAGFSGRWFNTLADDLRPHVITPDDIVAVSMLGVTVPAHVTAWILNDGRDEISKHLAQVPDAAITEVDAAVYDEGGDLAELWWLFRKGRWPEHRGSNGVGAVIAGKLLAAKRPALVPIWDSLIKARLSPRSGQYWHAMHAALNDPAIAEPTKRAVAGVGTTSDGDVVELSLLRKTDIICWMRQRAGE